MNILALDLGKFNSAACYFNSKTRNSKFVTVATKRPHFESMFADCGADLVVMEACGHSGWSNDMALKHGLKPIVCSTNTEAWETGRDRA